MNECKPREFPIRQPGVPTACVESILPVCVKKATDPHKWVAWQKKTCVDGKAVLTIYEDEEATIPAVGYSSADIVSCDGLQLGTTCSDPVHVKICVEEVEPPPPEVCQPTVSGASGNALGGLLPGNNISIQKPACCLVEVVTSAGSFRVTKGLIAYSLPEFACPVTVTAVNILSGNCTAASVVVTTQKPK